jgi:hypothetical protein
MYEILLINSEFGQVLNEEGNLHIRGQKYFRPKLETLELAIKEKDRLLEKYIYAGVIITNLDTGEKSDEFYNEELGPKFDEEKKEYRKWVSLPFYKRLFTKKPNFKYYDGKH